MIRTGLGVDVHAFAAGSGLTLGGVAIPFGKAIAAHSDGDVVIHAVVDALLGAAALGDIGSHFPSSDPQWQGVSSRVLLERCREVLAAAGASINSVDCSVILQEPQLAPFLAGMRRNLADDLGLDTVQVSIKATTTDQLGFAGRGDGIAALAVATLTTPDVATPPQ